MLEMINNNPDVEVQEEAGVVRLESYFEASEAKLILRAKENLAVTANLVSHLKELNIA